MPNVSLRSADRPLGVLDEDKIELAVLLSARAKRTEQFGRVPPRKRAEHRSQVVNRKHCPVADADEHLDRLAQATDALASAQPEPLDVDAGSSQCPRES